MGCLRFCPLCHPLEYRFSVLFPFKCIASHSLRGVPGSWFSTYQIILTQLKAIWKKENPNFVCGYWCFLLFMASIRSKLPGPTHDYFQTVSHGGLIAVPIASRRLTYLCAIWGGVCKRSWPLLTLTFWSRWIKMFLRDCFIVRICWPISEIVLH